MPHWNRRSGQCFRALALFVCAALAVSGCASMLERDYTDLRVHSAAPVVEEDQTAIRAESYQDLVNALSYFVTQRRTQGVVRLYNYPYTVEQDLEAACREVSTEDPLGAFALREIQYDVTPIVSCYEAKLSLRYRRSKAEIDAVVPATGSSAIRTALCAALARFQRHTALRVSHFDEGEEAVLELLREAYYSVPENALAQPEAFVSFYPASGVQRILELHLNYPLSQEELERRQSELGRTADELSDELWDCRGDEGLRRLCRRVLDSARYDPEGGSSAYDALVEGRADSQGLALALALLCKRLGYSCQIVQGALEGEAHSWNIVPALSGFRHVDLSQLTEGEDPFRSDRTMAELGCQWDTGAVPQCGEQPLPEPVDASAPVEEGAEKT